MPLVFRRRKPVSLSGRPGNRVPIISVETGFPVVGILSPARRSPRGSNVSIVNRMTGGHYLWFGKQQRLSRLLQRIIMDGGSRTGLVTVVSPFGLRLRFDFDGSADPYEGIPVRVTLDKRGPIQIYLPVACDIPLAPPGTRMTGRAYRTPSGLHVTLKLHDVPPTPSIESQYVNEEPTDVQS